MKPKKTRTRMMIEIGSVLFFGGYLYVALVAKPNRDVITDPYVAPSPPISGPLTFPATKAPERAVAAEADNNQVKSSDTVYIDIRVLPTNPPKFEGTTNLPDGLLPFALRGDKPGCYIQCGFMDSTGIKNGKFSFTVSMPDSGAAIEPDGYTLDILTNDSSKKLIIPFGDPTDKDHFLRFTARVIVSDNAAHIDKGSVRFLPFRMDQKYINDEYAHGHPNPQ